MIWLFCLTLLFAQEPPQEDELPPEPIQGMQEDDMHDEIPAQQGSLVKRLTESFNYERENKRDPFLLPEAKEAPLLPGAYFGPFLPLQEIKLSDVVIKGILMDRVKPKAIIQIMDNGKPRLIKVQVGDYLGENFGIIQAIREGKIIIVQTFGEGEKKSTSTITLSIRK